MQAALHKREQAASMLPRALELLRDAPDAATRAALSKVFGDHCDGVALWEWLPWLPQLLNCLKPHTVDGDDPASSGGSSQVQHLLIRIAKVYPQALYYPLRNYLADNKPTGKPPPAWTPTPPKPPPGAAPAAARRRRRLPWRRVRRQQPLRAGEGEEAKTETAPPSAPSGDVEMTEAESTVPLVGPAARILHTFKHEHPQLYMQLESAWDGLIKALSPTPTERLLHTLCELMTMCLAEPPGTNSLEASVFLALGAIDKAFGITTPKSATEKPLPAKIRTELMADLFSKDGGPSTLADLLAVLATWRSKLETELGSGGADDESNLLEAACWPLVALQQPLMEIPGQYADERAPALDQHVLVERFDASVIVRRDLATGETERVATLRADDGSTHLFSLKVATPLHPHATLGRERMGQLTRLLNGKLLRAREARRRALTINSPMCLRLGNGVGLIAASAAPRISMATALATHRLENGLAPHSLAIEHQKMLSKAPANEEASARKQRLKTAYDEIVKEVPEQLLTEVLHGTAPNAGSMWELQRRLTSQLGVQALLTYVLGLRAGTPQSIVLRRDLGSADLLEFGHECLGGGIPGASPLPNINNELCNVAGVPFRLTRGMLHLMSPLGLSGPFTGAICAAAECLANHSKCPLPLWMDTLARPEQNSAGEDSAAAGRAQGLVPWGTTGEAAAARVRELSPVLLTRSKKQGTEHKVDVHEAVQGLIDAATNIDAMCAMPSAFQAWI